MLVINLLTHKHLLCHANSGFLDLPQPICNNYLRQFLEGIRHG